MATMTAVIAMRTAPIKRAGAALALLLAGSLPATAATHDFYDALGGTRDGDLVTVEVNKGQPLLQYRWDHLPDATGWNVHKHQGVR